MGICSPRHSMLYRPFSIALTIFVLFTLEQLPGSPLSALLQIISPALDLFSRFFSESFWLSSLF